MSTNPITASTLPQIPEEVLCYIFAFIENEGELGRLAEVCKLWYKVSRKQSLWYNLPPSRFSIHFPKKKERECTWEMFSILYQELRWIVDPSNEGLSPSDPNFVFFEPSIHNSNQFPTYFASVGIWCNWGGKWYYEVQIESAGTMQLGFITHKFGANGKVKNQLCGVGDDAFSWSWDPWRSQAFHEFPKFVGGENIYAKEFGTEKSKDGSVVGVMLDLDSQELRYSVDGKEMGVVYDSIQLQDQFIFPAISIHGKYQGLFTRGKSSARFVFQPESMTHLPKQEQCNTFASPEIRVLRIKRREKLTDFTPYKALPALKQLFDSE